MRQLIIIGAGRLGTLLADAAWARGEAVTVIDQHAPALERLGEGFGGRVVQGDACHAEILGAAEPEAARVVCATGQDELNLLLALLARERFGAAWVCARVSDSRKRPLFEAMSVPTLEPNMLAVDAFDWDGGVQ